MTALHLSRDRKVTPRASRQPGGVRAGRWVARIYNSFGLPAGVSCPGKTEFCVDCYGETSEQSSGVGDALARNLAALQAAGTVDAMAALLDEMLVAFKAQSPRFPLEAHERVFRIHWDGDFFSEDYARAWRVAIERHGDVRFWCYTRSFTAAVNVVPILAGIPNLALYLSVDAGNVADARPVLEQHADVLIAGCGLDYESARAVALEAAPWRAHVPTPCPENTGRMLLVDNHQGACFTCGICITGRRDILFSTSHVEQFIETTDEPVTVRRKPRPGQPSNECRGPHCTKRVPRHVGPGRPLLYCSDACRGDAAEERRKVS